MLLDPTEVARPQARRTAYVGTLADGRTAGFWLLVLAVPYRGRALPFHFVTYSSRTIGAEATSRNGEHQRALAAVKGLLGEKPLVMDRECSYEGLLRDRVAARLHSVIRLNVESGVRLVEADGSRVSLSLQPGERRVLRGVRYKGTVPVNLAGEWQEGMEKPLWVITDLAPDPALELYQRRMQIEESLRDLKSLLGLGRLMNKQRVYMEKMVALLLMAYAIGLLVGEELRDLVYGGGGKMAAVFRPLCAPEAEARAAAQGHPLPGAQGLALLSKAGLGSCPNLSPKLSAGIAGECTMSLLLSRIRVHFTALQEGELPPLWGTTVRGALLATFRHLVCVTRLPACPPCRLHTSCPFPQVFEPAAPAHSAGYISPPRPFVVEVPFAGDERQRLRVGDSLQFDLVLWGPALQYVAYLLFALQEAGRQGIGPDRIKVRLTSAVAQLLGPDSIPVYEEGEELHYPLPTVPVEEIMEEPRVVGNQVRIIFLSPVRIRRRGHLVVPVSFADLIAAICQRLRAVWMVYGDDKPPWNERHRILAARQVQLVRNEQRWLDLERFSGRQKVWLKIGGVVGEAVYESPSSLEPFMPLLNLAEWFQVGKLATMGLGSIRIR